MTEINQGIDCTRRLKKPRYRLRVERRRIHAEPEELIMLRLLDVPTGCSPSCYVWRHVSGGGTLLEEVGEAVWYSAPSTNVGCMGSAIITVTCGDVHLDTVFIGSTTFGTPPVVLHWFEQNRTWPSPPGEYLKYRAVVIKTYDLYEAIKVYPPPLEDGEVEDYPFAPLFVGEAYKLKYVGAKGDPLPEGVTKEPRVPWPRDWKPGDPTPEGITIPEGTVFPEGWSYYLKFPTTKVLFRVTRSYDCNGIYLQTQAYARYEEGMEKWWFDRYAAVEDPTPVVVDARSPFLKGERVTLDEGAIIPFGWKPNSRGVAGLHIPGGTIWPPDWKKGDPFPKWDCCPARLLEYEED